MNAFLDYQNQLEEQFLNTIQSSNFEEICQDNIHFFQKHIRANFNYSHFSHRTARAKNPLQQFEDLISYIALYGLAHYQRFSALLDHIPVFTNQPMTKACIVDYGCGQGIATIAFIDHLIKTNSAIQDLKIVLIEPSAYALKRAIRWIEKKLNLSILISKLLLLPAHLMN